MSEPIQISLDICTLEGRTWLARITGPSDQYGVEREFVRAVKRDTSKSGRTGTATYLVGPGVYERREGRHRLAGQNGFFKVGDDGTITELESAAAALKVLAGDAVEATDG